MVLIAFFLYISGHHNIAYVTIFQEPMVSGNCVCFNWTKTTL